MELTIRSLLVAAVILGHVSWTWSRHHYTHNVSKHRSRHRRQGARLHLPASYVLPGGEGYGAWGPWGEPSACSRTCGGGVATQKRICLQVESDGRSRCAGGDTKYYSCNTQDCPPGSQDFRSQQCAEYDSKPFRGTYYHWVPYTKGPNPCELNCMPHAERFYYRHSDKVVDGTRCNDDSFDVCVNGVCQPVGCDMMLGSNAQEDKCRICRGNSTNCHTIDGVIDTKDLRQGYNDVLLIPEGSTTIVISEIQPSNNYLALRSKNNGTYYVNGNYRIDFPRSLVFAGCLWHYERDQQGLPSPDRFRSMGPTTEPLYLSLLLLQEVNVGIKYEYSIPSALVRPPNEQYNWVYEDFSPCSATCGGGTQVRPVTCRSRESLEVVEDNLCDDMIRPESMQACGTEPCPPRWVQGPWSPCSKPCGEGGTQSRQVYCERIIANGQPSVVDNEECYKLYGPPPALHQRCNENATCPSWFVGPWKPCDRLCGEGKQTRQVVCHQKIDDRVQVFADEQCSEKKPEMEKSCILTLCEGVDWVLSEFTGCDTCLSNIRTRTAYCVTKDRQIVNDSFCSYHPKPLLETDCKGTTKPKCEAIWYASQWGPCSVKCGKGVKMRRVFCGLFDGDSVTEVEDDKCDPDTKYENTIPCEEPLENCKADWFAGPWTECSKKCGGGQRERSVMCLSSADVTPPDLCGDKTVPDRTEACNEFPCNEDETIPVDASSTISDYEELDYCDEEGDYAEVGIKSASEPSDTTDLLNTMFSDSAGSGEGSGETFPTDTKSEFTSDSSLGTESSGTVFTLEDFSSTTKSSDSTKFPKSSSVSNTGSTNAVSSESASTITASTTNGSTSPLVTESTTSEKTGVTKASTTTASTTDVSTSPLVTESTTSEKTAVTKASTITASTTNGSTSPLGTESTTSEKTGVTKASTITASTTNGSTSPLVTESTTSEKTGVTKASTITASTTNGSTSPLGTESTTSEKTGVTKASTITASTTNGSTSPLVTESTTSEKTGLTKASTITASTTDVSTSPSGTESTTSEKTGVTKASTITASTTNGSTSPLVTESTTSEKTGVTKASTTTASTTDVSTSPLGTESTTSEKTGVTKASTITASTTNGSTSPLVTESTTSEKTGVTKASTITASTTNGSTSPLVTESTTSEKTGVTKASTITASTTDVSTSPSGTESTTSEKTGLTKASTITASTTDVSTSPSGTESTTSEKTGVTKASTITASTTNGSSSPLVTESTTSEKTGVTKASTTTASTTDVSTSPLGTESTTSEKTGVTKASTITASTTNGSTSPLVTESTTSEKTGVTKASTITASTTNGSSSPLVTESTTSEKTGVTKASTTTASTTDVSTSPLGTESTTSEKTGVTKASTITASTTNGSSSPLVTESTTSEKTGVTKASTTTASTTDVSTSPLGTESTTSEKTGVTKASTITASTTNGSTSPLVTESTTSEKTGVTKASTITASTTDGSTSPSGTESTTSEKTGVTKASTITASTTNGSTSPLVTESTTSEKTGVTKASTITASTTDGSTSPSGTESTTSEKTGVTKASTITASTTYVSTSPSGTESTTSEKTGVTKASTITASTTNVSTSPLGTESTTSEKTGVTKASTITASTTNVSTSPLGTESTTSEKTGVTKASTITASTTDGSSSPSGTESTTSEKTGVTKESTTEIESSIEGSSKSGSSEESMSTTESSTTEVSTLSSEVETTESTSSEGSTESTTEISSSTEVTMGSSESSTLSSESTSEVSSTEMSTSPSPSETGSTESESTTSTGVSGNTEGTAESGSTTTEEVASTGLSEGSTRWDWASTVEVYTKRPRCRPRRRPTPPCADTTFGCCPDNKTPAEGPFARGCKVAKMCNETEFGCCADELTAVSGPHGAGCPPSACAQSLYGCCKSDNKTEAQGNDDEGCPPPPPACQASEYGCCEDGTTEAKGPEKKGCPETEEMTTTEMATTEMATTEMATTEMATTEMATTEITTVEGIEEESTTVSTTEMVEGCVGTEFGCCADNVSTAAGPGGQGCPCHTTDFGCCPDNVTSAQGPDKKGCVLSCNTSAHGCCPDGQTPAHGPDYEGCCLFYSFGCCPDNFRPAKGPRLEGCDCQSSRYGCCPDNVTVAHGPQLEGCGCKHAPHGCCPDRHTEALGPNYEGCTCHTYQFGCCPDGVTIAIGPNLQGCSCMESTHGCCGDGETAAQGPNFAGCDCASSKYGCCPDGRTEAQGEHFLGCIDAPENKQEWCALARDRGGPCNNYTVHWYYDVEYGGCSRFWYGGCGGNGNRFASQADCEDVCVHPPRKDACKLPKVKGVCDGYNLRWYFDMARGQCGQFVYGGCLGNDNNFETREACQAQCEPPKREDQCKMPIEAGSCAGNFPRWAFNAEAEKCEQFAWSGCEGNYNRFLSEQACIYRCDTPGVLKEECLLPQAVGNCTEKLAKWSFSQPENRCVPFYYTGCNGNGNRFDDERACADKCPSVYEHDLCTLPASVGDCADYRERWYYDTTNKRCRPFYWGGCGGNANNFASEADCSARCADATPTTTVRPTQDDCFLDIDSGPCGGAEVRWAYEPRVGSCRQFTYGGCGGNRNNFPSLEHCQYHCSRVLDVCQLPMLAGPCSESIMRWFYDATTDSCSQFSYGGCDGNDNRFETREECERRCRTGVQPPDVITTTTALPNDTVPVECRVSSTLEPCAERNTVWYYEEHSRQCAPYENSGAGLQCRYANVHRSEEECERRCGAFRKLDVCRYDLDAGPCSEQVPKFYWDAAQRTCAPFTYGGCHGGPNRFSSLLECREVCGSPDLHDPCILPTDQGTCGGYFIKWYYDATTQSCNRFVYGGCQGNANRFDTLEECEGRCKKIPSTTTEVATPPPPPPPPQPELEEECRVPASLSPCGRNITAYYYDVRRGCAEAPIGDCPYLNRYHSEEECERRCGRFKEIDVCAYGPEPGPCDGSVPKVYWDSAHGRCDQFTYSGCGGGPNRFSTLDECSRICGGATPASGRCQLRADVGACPGPSVSRWYFNEAYGDCLPFVYTGCGGNDNNFRSYRECAAACRPTATGFESNEVVPNCDPYKEECSRMNCEYGVRRESTAEGCERCACAEDPCAATICAPAQRCVVLRFRDPLTGLPRYEAECRLVNKPGDCPYGAADTLSEYDRRECLDDADCRGAQKCCAGACVRPRATTAAPLYTSSSTINPLEPAAPVSDPRTPPRVVAREDGAATLTCIFHGNPPPKITWQRDQVVIDGTVGRYRIHTDGSLEIVSLYRNDSGVYVCIAQNPLGAARQEIHLQVTEPSESPAAISGEPAAVVVGELGRGLALRCLAYGHPRPEITWYRGERGPMVPFISQQYEARGNLLKIRSLDLDAVGEYACHAYNGVGSPATWKVVVKAERPPGYYGDNPYLLSHDAERTTRSPPPTEPTPPPPPLPEEPPLFTAVVVTHIVAESTTFGVGSELSLLCEVDGYPLPDVAWTKDGVQLMPGGRIQISEAHRLTISSLKAEDSGQYTCSARNEFSAHQDTVAITVEGVSIPETCTDNPFFANCKLIVRSKFCKHVYYSNFCCRSCMEAGQLRPEEAPTASIAAWRRK